MNSKILFGLFILTLLITSCITEFNAKLPSSAEEILIVDGSIVEDTTVVFHLSKSFSLDAQSPPQEAFNVSATLTIIGDNGYQSSPATNLGNGAYQIPVGKLDDNVSYGLQIDYNGNTYKSTLSKPIQTPEIDSVSFSQPENYGNINFQVSTHDNTDGAKYFIWNYTENWEVTANYLTIIFYNVIDSTFYLDYTAPLYFCWKSATSNQLLIGSTESLTENRIINKQFYQADPADDRFSHLYCITVNQQAISKGAYEYYQNKITLNQDMGGLFTPQPSELTGNISCTTDPSKKVMGYVETVKNTTQKRLFVYAGQITSPIFSSNCALITQDSILTLMHLNRYTTYNQVLSLGLRPAETTDPKYYPYIIPANWSHTVCTDCVAAGGSKNKPDFWPNDDK